MNNQTNHLGRLQPVDPRTVWISEAGDFTPWLAKEENLSLLGDTIGQDVHAKHGELLQVEPAGVF